jgi:hypothetical protein
MPVPFCLSRSGSPTLAVLSWLSSSCNIYSIYIYIYKSTHECERKGYLCRPRIDTLNSCTFFVTVPFCDTFILLLVPFCDAIVLCCTVQ